MAVKLKVPHMCAMSASDPHFRLRLPPDLKAKIEKAARTAGRSINAEIVARLAASVANDKRQAARAAAPEVYEATYAAVYDAIYKAEFAEAAERNLRALLLQEGYGDDLETTLQRLLRDVVAAEDERRKNA